MVAASLDLAVFLAAAALSFALLLLLRPWLQRYALAHPNARSSHTVPTPQGAGIGVIAATVATVAGASVSARGHWRHVIMARACRNRLYCRHWRDRRYIANPGAATAAVAGRRGRRRPRGAAERIAYRVCMPYWLERVLLAFAILWFVNLVNFMDGIDWMTVAEVVPVTVAIAFIGIILTSPQSEIVRRACALRRHGRLCSIQPAGGEAIPW